MTPASNTQTIEVEDEFVGDVKLPDISALFTRTVKKMGSQALLHDLTAPDGRSYSKIKLKITLELTS